MPEKKDKDNKKDKEKSRNFSCSICGKKFSSEKGLHIHQAKVHDGKEKDKEKKKEKKPEDKKKKPEDKKKKPEDKKKKPEDKKEGKKEKQERKKETEPEKDKNPDKKDKEKKKIKISPKKEEIIKDLKRTFEPTEEEKQERQKRKKTKKQKQDKEPEKEKTQEKEKKEKKEKPDKGFFGKIRAKLRSSVGLEEKKQQEINKEKQEQETADKKEQKEFKSKKQEKNMEENPEKGSEEKPAAKEKPSPAKGFKPAEEKLETTKEIKEKKRFKKEEFVDTGIKGFDNLLKQGIPEGTTVIVAGGAGSGKTIFCLQSLAYHAAKGKKCLYMSFEEPVQRLIYHMKDFGLEPEKLIEKDNLRIIRKNPFDITRNVDALLAQQKGELLIDVQPVIIPKDFKPDFIAIDSLTAIASAFTGKEDSYRIYIEQLFRFFEDIHSTSYLITETELIPKVFSKTGVEEFLADGVIVIYNIKRRNVRERAIEILKLRGAEHEKRIVAFEITGEGITVYPDQEVFGGVEGD